MARQISSAFKLRPSLPSQPNGAALLLRGENPLRSVAEQGVLPVSRRNGRGYWPLLHGHPLFAAHSPDFFSSQSSSIFSRPISPYSRSSSACAAGLGPRFPSNNVAARARISFFIAQPRPDAPRTAARSRSGSSTPRIASIPTFALNSALCTFRFLPSLMPSPSQDGSLNPCLKIGVHYNWLAMAPRPVTR